MKRLAISAMLAVGLVFVGQAAASATLEPSLGPFTSDDNSQTPKTTFSFDETPFSFIQFDPEDINASKPLKLRWTWKFEHGLVDQEYDREVDLTGDPFNTWNSLDIWDSVKEPGEWSVKTNWFNLGEGGGFEVARFNVAADAGTETPEPQVAPEPLTMGLFLLGGTTLAAGMRRRKRISSLT